MNEKGPAKRVLIIEDQLADAELIHREVEKELGPCKTRVVETREGLLDALERFNPDLIVSDYLLPLFDGLSALKISVEQAPDTPFIVCTSSLNEETAVACMNAGAWNYVLKEHIHLLGPAVHGALQEKKNREEKHRIEKALTTAGREWRATFDAMGDAVCVVNSENTVIRANRSFRELADRPWDEVVHKELYSFFPDMSHNENLNPCDVASSTGSRVVKETLLGNRWFRLVADPVISEGKSTGEVILILSDITEKKSLEQDLNEKAEWMIALTALTHEIAQKSTLEEILSVVVQHLEESFQCAFAAVLIKTGTGNEYAVSRVGSRGKESAASCGFMKDRKIDLDNSMPILKRAYPEKLEMILLDGAPDCELKKCLAAGGIAGIIFVPIVLEKESIGVIIMAFDWPGVLSEAQKDFINSMSEYTALALRNWKLYSELENSYAELKETRERVMEQNKLQSLGQIASGIAHDINNTLAPITLYTGALLDMEPDLSDRAKRYIGTIKKAAGDIERVVTRLRAFYKNDEGVDKESVSVDELFKDVIDMTRPRWKDVANKMGAKITVSTSVEEGADTVCANKSELRESIINLVFNAADAMPEGGHLELVARTENKSICIEVRDSGTGMPEAVRDRCFDPFFTTKGVKGSGLGLPMVYGMIRRHGGNISIETAEQSGTRVLLYFPAETGQKDLKKSGTVVEKAQLSLKILLIDDDERVLDVLNEMLELEGHGVTAVRSGEEGLKIFFESATGDASFDLVMTDLGMPGVDGLEVGRQIKSSFPDVPVILLTGWGSFMDEEYGQVDLLLSKPPTMDSLRSAIATVCGSPEE